jgi:hypothetical protein
MSLAIGIIKDILAIHGNSSVSPILHVETVISCSIPFVRAQNTRKASTERPTLLGSEQGATVVLHVREA